MIWIDLAFFAEASSETPMLSVVEELGHFDRFQLSQKTLLTQCISVANKDA